IRVGQHITRRRRRRDELQSEGNGASEVARVLDAFVAEGLIRRFPAEDPGDARFEISHEAVIRHWPRLLNWLQERRRDTEARERVVAALERWRASGRSFARLLTGHALNEGLAYRGHSPALDEFLTLSRRWRTFRISLVAALCLLFLLWVVWDHIQQRGFTQELKGLAQDASQAESAAFEVGARGDYFRRRAALADHTLLRLMEAGAVDRASLPALFLERARVGPGSVPGSGGYDPDFLNAADAGAGADAIPLPRSNSNSVRTLRYPHLTILYDVRRRIPLLAASNYDRRAEPLRPFRGIGFFPDPRLPRGQQSSERVSADPNSGRVPLISFPEVAWARSRTDSEAAFLSFAPLSVVQPWSFHLGLWLKLETHLLDSDADRITFFTGPLLPPDDPPAGASLVPTAYWKIALFRDPASGAIVTDAYIVPVNAPAEVPLRNLRTTVAEISRRSGIDLRYLMRGAPHAASAEAPAAAAESAMPTVYIQFAVMPRWRAVEISRALAEKGYVLPGEERVETATNLLEVRYGNDDAEAAGQLAEHLREVLADLGYSDRPVRVVRLRGRQPPRGVIEVWIGIAPPAPQASETPAT
ncbi:MAG: DNA/RNA non-specific endonuclease, partial [Pseudomonadota bacterium]|nr:DNA/RNA non-specific endonuclease [Pseudomonadota bacterium]